MVWVVCSLGLAACVVWVVCSLGLGCLSPATGRAVTFGQWGAALG
jgi:hypothetical protein